MKPTSISFVMPMYNESQLIGETIKEVTAIARELSDDYEIVVADDGSSDGSDLIIKEIAEKDPRIKAVCLEKNTKFGGALRAAIKTATKEIIVYTDSDLPVDASDIKGALSVLGDYDIVTGFSPVKKGENLRRIIISKVYNFLIQFLFRTDVKDINSGLKIYRRKIFKHMNLISNSPFIDVEIFIKAAKKDFTVKKYPIRFKHRKKGKSYISKPAVILKMLADMLNFKFGIK